LREASGVTEVEICDSTKVSQDYLQAIESNRFERLPQAVFVKGFLRSFCRYLGVPDPEVIVTAFSARLMDWQNTRKA
jgi:cytoskeleton protein RodZ